ncbi:hypothetical protein F3Y22_tig00110949pilonHSYRG00015 [Hibiscus syriacus]|uniref:Uncharacterized protein n=1 Tax=Hibiscus syriacus TaxID=106335 RepID=A0A6A2ZCW9_HIBSY|nr:hypothetical protein F3Y22_tig00110949pilonHSYRG00015 [Hibiscus syriacus]
MDPRRFTGFFSGWNTCICNSLTAKRGVCFQQRAEDKICNYNTRNTRATSISGFIVNDSVDDPELDDSNYDEDHKLDDSNHDDDEDDLYESVCAICDNGGNIICCDGRCMRSFHPTTNEESACESLGLNPKQEKVG